MEDYYHYLSNETYEWITTALGECCPSGRVVSVLEGGYSLEARVSRAKAAQQVWYGVVRYGMVWYGTVWYGMVWYGMVWYGMVWYGMI